MNDVLKEYIPKGSMCIACIKFHTNCSKLDFRSMPIYKITNSSNIVICSEFKRKN